MAAEVPDGTSTIRLQAKHHYEEFRAIIKGLIAEVLDSDPKYQTLDLQYVTDHFMILQIGALTNAEIY